MFIIQIPTLFDYFREVLRSLANTARQGPIVHQLSTTPILSTAQLQTLGLETANGSTFDISGNVSINLEHLFIIS